MSVSWLIRGTNPGSKGKASRLNQCYESDMVADLRLKLGKEGEKDGKDRERKQGGGPTKKGGGPSKTGEGVRELRR